jgi:hypothetical protein
MHQRSLSWLFYGIFAVITTLASTLAQALVIDSGVEVIDTSTRLRWLDLSQTDGLAKVSIDDQLGFGGQFNGYRFATYSEVAQFWANVGIVGTRFDTQWYPQNVAPIQQLASFMGGFTGTSGGGCLNILGGYSGSLTSVGTFEAPYLFLSNSSSCSYGLSGRAEHNWNWYPDTPEPTIGSWLVATQLAPIPEPSTAFLLVAGAFSCLLYGQAKRNSADKDANLALNQAPFGRWTRRDKAALRRVALRCASPTPLRR